MQPYLFPYIGYFQAINEVDKYILYDDINFIKKAWINRNKHLLKNGDCTYFLIPLNKKSSFKKINEIEIIENNIWKRRILKSIFFNYKKAKYFESVFPLIEDVINYPTNKLTEINYQSIKSVCDFLEINTVISKDSFKYKDIESKLSNDEINKNNFPDLMLHNWDRKVVRILGLCRIEKANIYINAIGGLNLYSKDDFSLNGIDLKFIKTKSIKYMQFSNDFVPNLSIIDVLMFNSKRDIKEMLTQFMLI